MTLYSKLWFYSNLVSFNPSRWFQSQLKLSILSLGGRGMSFLFMLSLKQRKWQQFDYDSSQRSMCLINWTTHAFRCTYVQRLSISCLLKGNSSTQTQRLYNLTLDQRTLITAHRAAPIWSYDLKMLLLQVKIFTALQVL